MPNQTLDPERFERLRERFAQLGDELSDDQLLTLADTYHEILRLRRHKRGWAARAEHLRSVAGEPRTFAGS